MSDQTSVNNSAPIEQTHAASKKAASKTKKTATANTVVLTHGEQALFTLWLLVTTNSAYLLDASAAARAAAQIPGNPGPLPDINPNPGPEGTPFLMSDLVQRFQDNNLNAPNFDEPSLTAFLTDTLSTPLNAVDFPIAHSYADVLANACTVFQRIAQGFVNGYNPPCPRSTDDIFSSIS